MENVYTLQMKQMIFVDVNISASSFEDALSKANKLTESWDMYKRTDSVVDCTQPELVAVIQQESDVDIEGVVTIKAGEDAFDAWLTHTHPERLQGRNGTPTKDVEHDTEDT